MKISTLSVAATIYGLASYQAAADVLTLENAIVLCKDDKSGKRFVSRAALAEVIIEDAGAGRYIKLANEELKRRSPPPTALIDELYVIQHTAAPISPGMTREEAESSTLPFGETINLREVQGAYDARNKVAADLAALSALLEREEVEVDQQLTYRFVGARQPVTPDPAALELFEEGSLRIECDTGNKPIPRQKTVLKGPSEKGTLANLKGAFKLRGKVSDLNFPQADIQDLSFATIGFVDDGEASTKTSSINGVLGVSVFDLYYDLQAKENSREWDLIPFLSFTSKRVDHKDDNDENDDIGVLAPGLLAVNRIENCNYSVHSRLEGTLIDDYEQNARQIKARLYIDPAFSLIECPKPKAKQISPKNPFPIRLSEEQKKLGPGILFGSYLEPLGGLIQFRPDVTLIGDISDVLDAGDSEELEDAGSYYGLGGELSLSAIIAEGISGPPFTDFIFTTGIRNIWLAGDVDENDIKRWYAELSYSPTDFPYLGTSLSYTKGQDGDTLQKEDLFALNFSVRF